MTSIRNRILGIESEWVIMNGDGEILERFRLKATAMISLDKHTFDGTENLRIVEVDK